MGDLIFVPELGLIPGKSQKLKARMFYPLPNKSKIRIRRSPKYKKKLHSYLIQAQHLLDLRNQTDRLIQQKENKNLCILKVGLQPRPLTVGFIQKFKDSLVNRSKFEPSPKKIDPNSFRSDIEINEWEQRLKTRAGIKQRRLSAEISSFNDLDNILNFPALNQRPIQMHLEW